MLVRVCFVVFALFVKILLLAAIRSASRCSADVQISAVYLTRKVGVLWSVTGAYCLLLVAAVIVLLSESRVAPKLRRMFCRIHEL